MKYLDKQYIINHKYIISVFIISIILLVSILCIISKYINQESYADIINKVESAKIVDLVENQYEDELNIDIKEKDLEKLKKVLINSKPVIKSNIASNVYKIELYDKNNKLVETLIINYNKNIISSRGTFEDKSIEEYCEKVEKKYKISYDKLLKRKPGKHYFKDLVQCKFGTILNNDTGKSKSLSDENINAIKFDSDIKILKRHDFNLKYRITLIDESENITYVFDVSSDNKVYCNKWELDGNIVIIINNLIEELKI